MNMYRSGGDMRADWPLMLRRLQTIVPWLGLSRPGCWAYLLNPSMQYPCRFTCSLCLTEETFRQHCSKTD
jgi:hypothetical protein